MRVRVGHSPDPDDAFLFYALTTGKVCLPGVEITHCLQPIEELNEQVLDGQLEMTAISVAAYPYCADRYLLLPTGASVGDGYGPVVVAKEELTLKELSSLPVAVPGRMTTAVLLLQLAVGKVELAVFPFDQILPAVEDGEVRAGVLIHEGQLTYAARGLKKILDLGTWWKQRTHLPLPLGINVVRRDLGSELRAALAVGLKESLDYALHHRAEALSYCQRFARGLDPSLTDRFVGMYVNDFAIDCRPLGASAMERLLDWAHQAGLTPRRVPIEFADSSRGI